MTALEMVYETEPAARVACAVYRARIRGAAVLARVTAPLGAVLAAVLGALAPIVAPLARFIPAPLRRLAVRSLRTLHAVMAITRRHVPAWLAGALTAALVIPGPFDEIALGLVVAWYAWKRPEMRAELRAGVRVAWNGRAL